MKRENRILLERTIFSIGGIREVNAVHTLGKVLDLHWRSASLMTAYVIPQEHTSVRYNKGRDSEKMI